MKGQRCIRWPGSLALILSVAVGLGIVGLVALFAVVSAQSSGTVSGVVVDADGPVAGATVRIQATTNATTSATDGSFTLGGLPEGITVTVSAWKHTYYCAKVEGVMPPASG
ncbi:MAG: carboxypeptidase regulatory-like domain-containing protein, partial [Anaerolineae bacterium]